MPKPYRRACNDCVNAKRRCDLGLPSCHRCKTRQLTCVYGSTKANQAQTNGTALDITNQRPHSGTSYEIHGNGEVVSWPPYTTNLSQDTGFELLPAELDFNSTLPAISNHWHNLNWPDLMTDVDAFTVPDRLPSDHVLEYDTTVGDVYQARVMYVVKRMKPYPAQFVEKGQNPFINLGAFGVRLPTHLSDAFALCALSKCRNTANESFVFSSIQGKVSRLVHTHSQSLTAAISTPSTSSIREHLSATQALLLYQIIRLFDGALRLRHDAERDAAYLFVWTQRLRTSAPNVILESTDGKIDLENADIGTATWHD